VTDTGATDTGAAWDEVRRQLREARRQRDVSQRRLATRIGCYQSSLSDWESGKAGVVILKPGATIDSIDLDAVVAQRAIDGQASVDTGFSTSTRCPKCGEEVTLLIRLLVGNDVRLAQAYVDRTTLDEHDRQCTGSDGSGR
jgi:transcriptional regulator with XRE-family HTH domain